MSSSAVVVVVDIVAYFGSILRVNSQFIASQEQLIFCCAACQLRSAVSIEFQTLTAASSRTFLRLGSFRTSARTQSNSTHPHASALLNKNSLKIKLKQTLPQKLRFPADTSRPLILSSDAALRVITENIVSVCKQILRKSHGELCNDCGGKNFYCLNEEGET